MFEPTDLAARVARTRPTAAAAALLAPGTDDRFRAWDIRKGITAPADFRPHPRRPAAARQTGPVRAG
ncbi:hypothetical protein [Actinokineospora enzanensis]|uniref:hypothetical protein n=1 Tax=Actinokineospora enzanensis TaxID=155975 RepID=UPI000363FA43|nr:hypothetical protein [Actinokineospora enzanensis]